MVRVQIHLGLVLLLLTTTKAAVATTTTTSTTTTEGLSYLDCDLYIAESTIPNAGIGIYSGVSKTKNERIGNGDKAIPLLDILWHNGWSNGWYDATFFNPTENYVWAGDSMGMGHEVFSASTDLAAFWPGIDAMVNSYSGLLNLEKATPIYDEGGLHRAKHPGAGSLSPYQANPSVVTREIPVGGELFKSYGEEWFLGRSYLGPIPLTSHYNAIVTLLLSMHQLVLVSTTTSAEGVSTEEEEQQQPDADSSNKEEKEEEEKFILEPSILYQELLKEMQDIWNESRTLNALHDFTWKEIEIAIDFPTTLLDPNRTKEFDNYYHGNLGILLQPNATRSIDWLNELGKCIDHIVPQQSTIDGAGHGAFAKRELPEGTIITGTPLLHFPDKTWFDMYNFHSCHGNRSVDVGDGNRDDASSSSYMVRDLKAGPYAQQLLINYCFGHPQSTLILCPYGSGVNYINHASSETANVKLQWSQNGTTNHNNEWFTKDPTDMQGDHQTRLAMDYIALRTIHKGEELFFDYGREWEDKWRTLSQQHAAYFTTNNNEHQNDNNRVLHDYISAQDYNRQHGEEKIRTTQEQLSDPYPSNLSLRCHYSLNTLPDGYNRTIITAADVRLAAADADAATADIADAVADIAAIGAAYATHQQQTIDWTNYLTGDPNGYECHIEKRQGVEITTAVTADDTDIDTDIDTDTDTTNQNDNPIVTHLHVESYTVTFIGTHNESTVSKTLTGVLRDYIKFADLPYTTDLHMMGTFRQPAGIPDDIFPDAWRNDIKKKTCTAAAVTENDNEEDQNCQWDNEDEEEKDEELDVDPCTLYYADHLRDTEEEQHSDVYIPANENENEDAQVDADDTLPTNDGHNSRSVSGVLHSVYYL